MFTTDEIRDVVAKAEFRTDFAIVQESLALTRLKQGSLLLNGSQARLSHFVEAVLASASTWEGDRGHNYCRQAAEIAELLSGHFILTPSKQRLMRVRAALLYELAELPTLSGTVLGNEDLSQVLMDFFVRRGPFKSLVPDSERFDWRGRLPTSSPPVEMGLNDDAIRLMNYEQGDIISEPKTNARPLSELAAMVSLELTATEVRAFERILRNRTQAATRSVVDSDLFKDLKHINFPAELWTSQVEALRGGLLDSSIHSWGFAAPTGSGKSFLCRALILNTLRESPGSSILYLVPSRALVHEVSDSLGKIFDKTEFKVSAVTPQLSELTEEETADLADISVAVMTPEKADLLLRLGVEFIMNASLVIIDEAHHIEAGTRGVLLEMYLWRLRKLLPQSTRVVFLSAVAPNIGDLAAWMGANSRSVTSDKRSTRMRSGVYRIRGTGRHRQGWIDYSDGISLRLIESGVESGLKAGLVQLAHKLSTAGPVLIVTKGKGECETLADEMLKWLAVQNSLNPLSAEERKTEYYQRLDSRLEREMYSSIKMRKLLPFRIAYHHAGLPPRVRYSVEEAIRQNLVHFVFATTTLAEGVNFPFSTVIVQSLALREPPEKGRPSRYHAVTPRSFWNIAGRAGRPGFDREGQAILYEPSLGLERINAVIDPYLNPSLNAIRPVESALNANCNEITRLLDSDMIAWEDLEKEVLPENVSRSVHGAVNLLRVGIVHARASRIPASPEEMLDGMFASKRLQGPERNTLLRLLESQTKVVTKFLNSQNAPPVDLVAELGISIETLSQLRDYVASLESWKIENFAMLFFGGTLNLDQAPYVIGPVAKRMAELEGPKLGGIYSEVIVNWLAGVPLEIVRARSQNIDGRLEDLIATLYSRIQYLLPWGLYAMDRIVKEEAIKRGIEYGAEILSLATLADAGVPSFDALRLVRLEFERVDATRLSDQYRREGGVRLGLDILGWLKSLPIEVVEKCVRGAENRRIDYDLPRLLKALA